MAELGSTIKCENCHRKFTLLRKKQRFCSRECRAEWWAKERKRDKADQKRDRADALKWRIAVQKKERIHELIDEAFDETGGVRGGVR